MEGKNTRMPRLENMVNCINSRMPVIFIEITQTEKDPKDLELSGRPIKSNGRVRTATPTTKLKALRLQLVKFCTRSLLKQRISLKHSKNRIVRHKNEGCVVSIL